MTSAARRGARTLAGAHLAQAGVLLLGPPTVLRTVFGDQDVPPSWVVRVLGIRTLAQGIAECLRPRHDVLAVGVAVDLAHAASMLAAATRWPQYRRAALSSAGAAAASAALGAAVTWVAR